MTYQRILIGIDSSPCSFHAAKKGFTLAHQLNATVGLIFVIDQHKEITNPDLGITPQQSQSILLQQAEESIEQLVKLYHESGDILRFTPEGYPKEQILITAKDWNADLIIIGTHGRSGLAHLLMGSVAEHIIRHAQKPVMIVPEEH